jgi:adenylate kinase family enzyme
MRINVTGNAGSGKTTLAARLGADLGLPVFSLDAIVWQPRWTKTPPAARLAAEQRLTAPTSWIVEGVSEYVRTQADLIVFLDVPRRVCTWRALSRTLRYLNRTRPGFPDPCPEIQILPRLLKLIHRFPQRGGADIHREAAAQPNRFLTEHHPVRVDRLLRRLRAWRTDLHGV